MEILKTKNLTFTYPNRKTPTVKNVSITVNKGEFITVLGKTGSGKSTFLKLLKKEISPKGEIDGKIFFQNTDLSEISPKDSASSIGYVMQRPEMQIVTDKVWHELAFGLENLNVPSHVISLRIAEMASYFGIEDLFDKSVDVLSGGQKQMLNLASVMVMSPKLLLLDEPTSQLDPIAASEFVATLEKINRDMGVTVIIVEHRLEELISVSDKIMVFEDGEVSHFDSPQNIIHNMSSNDSLLSFFPLPSRFYKTVGGEGKCPMNVREGRAFLEKHIKTVDNKASDTLKKDSKERKTNIAIEFENVFFRYDKKSPDVLKNFTFKVYENEIFCLLGGNGSGKSTLLSVASNLLHHYSGKVKIFGKKLKEYKNLSLYNECLTYLPQDVQALFSYDTVGEEANYELLSAFGLGNLKEKHPYDLSVGEQQLLALCKVVETNPKIILLDEPTKGLDPLTKQKIIETIKSLKASGKTVFIVTHDIEFSAECADRCGLIFNGNIASVNETKDFFVGNKFYSTVSCKMSYDTFSKVVTLNDLVDAFRNSLKEN